MIAAPQGEQNTAYRFSHYFEQHSKTKYGSLKTSLGSRIQLFYFCKIWREVLAKGSGCIYNNIKYFVRCITEKLSRYFKDVKSVGFFGFGRSNRAIFERLSRLSWLEFTLRDERVRECPDGIGRLCLGEECLMPPYEDILFLSPSVRRDRPELVKMSEAGTRLSSDAELFFELCDLPILAVSGSDGKSTTVTMTEAILKRRGVRAVACGNLGLPFISVLDGDCECIVAEISSFTLEYLAPRSHRALITNITENHLDWHGSFGGYIAAKENLIRDTEGAILSPDTESAMALIEKHRPRGIFSGRYGFTELLRRYPFAERIYTSEGGHLCINGEWAAPVSSLAKKEDHNIKNALSAIALTDGLFNTGGGIEALSDFSAPSHRAETVAVADGVRYVDSSIDSSPARTSATLSAMPKRTHIILGGRGKGLSYAPLIPPLLHTSGAIIICGENRYEIKAAMDGIDNLRERIILCDDLLSAVRVAVRIAERGDTVLLSPASTSFDAFSNFEERGNKFKEYIKNITEGTK